MLYKKLLGLAHIHTKKVTEVIPIEVYEANSMLAKFEPL